MTASQIMSDKDNAEWTPHGPPNGHTLSRADELFNAVFVNEHAERGFLGGAMLDDRHFDEASTGITSASFHDPLHGRLFKVLKTLRDGGDSLNNPQLIVSQARQMGFGGEDGINVGVVAELVRDQPHGEHISTFASILKDTEARRKAHAAGIALAKAAFEQPTIGNCIEIAQERLATLGRQWRTGATVTLLSAIEERPPRWLWQDRFLAGKLNTLSGNPGEGKTFLACYMAATVSRGGTFHGSTEPTEAGDVLFLTAEDGADDTLVPRLTAAGADLDRIAIVNPKHGPPITSLYRDLPRIKDAAAALPNPKLIIVDPVGSFMQGVDCNTDAEVRPALAGLIEFAAETDIAILFVSHLRKGTGRAINRTMGSMAFVGLARAAWLICEDAEEPGRRLFLRQKCNLSAVTTGLAFRLEGVPGKSAPRVAWERDAVKISADEALDNQEQQGKRPGKLNETKDWLSDFLTDGEKQANDVYAAAKKHGHSVSTVRRAKDALKDEIATRREGFQGPWLWKLKETPPAQ